MNANALMIAGWLVLLAGVIVRIIGDRSAGAGILIALRGGEVEPAPALRC